MIEEIIQLEEKLRQAMLTNDIYMLHQLINEDLAFITPDGNVANKEMDLQAHKAKLQVITEIVPSEQNIIINNNTATVNVKMQIVGTFGNVDISGIYRYLRIWKQINNNWQIIAGSVTKIQ